MSNDILLLLVMRSIGIKYHQVIITNISIQIDSPQKLHSRATYRATNSRKALHPQSSI